MFVHVINWLIIGSYYYSVHTRVSGANPDRFSETPRDLTRANSLKELLSRQI